MANAMTPQNFSLAQWMLHGCLAWTDPSEKKIPVYMFASYINTNNYIVFWNIYLVRCTPFHDCIFFFFYCWNLLTTIQHLFILENYLLFWLKYTRRISFGSDWISCWFWINTSLLVCSICLDWKCQINVKYTNTETDCHKLTLDDAL